MGLLRQPTGDITQGVIWKQLIGFFFPLWFGTFFQQLYNTVDTLVVGRFVGKVALAAVGSTGVIVNLTVGIFTGLSAGAVVIIAQQFGARKWEDVHKSVHTTMLLGVIVGAFFMVAGFILTPWALRAMGTTEEAMPGAVLYLRVYFLGMVPNVVYNMGTGVLRAIGDFRRPLYFLIAASGCNIVLDLLLVLVFHLDVAGVAIATICSQLLSAVLVVVALLRSEMTPYQLFPRQLHIHPEPMRGILHIGVPTALQSVMYSASNIVIQAAINSFGTDTVAAWVAFGKVDALFWLILSAFGVAIMTFVGQNYGARKFDRVHKSLKVALAIAAVTSIVFSAVLLLVGQYVFRLFTNDQTVMDVAIYMMMCMVPGYVLYVPIELISGALRGMGDTLIPTVITAVGICALRVLWIFAVVPLWHDILAITISYPISWLLTSAAFILYYARVRRKLLPV